MLAYHEQRPDLTATDPRVTPMDRGGQTETEPAPSGSPFRKSHHYQRGGYPI